MPARVSFKISLLMFLGSLIFVVGAAFLLSYLLSGPRLGAHYDFLIKYKKNAVSNEIFVIETDEYIEGSDFYTVLMTLTEMEASNLILSGRLSPSATPITLTEADVRRRFTDEYNLVGANIRNLFEGIRMGYVTPLDAPVYVEQVVESAEQGRDRLITTLIDRDEDLLRSVSVFGNYIDGYTKPQLDKDGKLRRAKPIDSENNIEHPVYANLKHRYTVSRIETSGRKKILWLRSHDGKDLDLTLDSESNIISPWNAGFRSVNIDLFRMYEDSSNAMLEALALANELKIFSDIPPDQIPLFLGEYAQTLLDELLKTPSVDNRYAWISARNNYFRSLEAFFNSTMEEDLISRYEEIIADTDSSNKEELAFLINAKNELIEVFMMFNDAYGELSSCHSYFKKELPMSLCIIGPRINAQYNAILANSLITGNHIKPFDEVYALLFAIAASLVILVILVFLRPVIILIAGIFSCFLCAALCGVFFIFFSYWIDPLIALGSSLAACLALFFSKSLYLSYRARSFRAAYRTAVSKDHLRKLINWGRPGLSEVNATYAAIIAIKDTGIFNKEEKDSSKEAGKMKRAFYTLAKKILFNSGAVIAGYEGDTILACFGSPLEIQPKLTTYKWTDDGQPLAKSYHPSDKACLLVRQILKNEKIAWRFGIDYGLCSFSWSPETGFTVSGQPAVHARNLVLKTVRWRARALISDNVREKINLDGSKMKTLPGQTSVFEILP
ncbi:MAG: hypothetical protein FWB95_01720 [Treponema sp.]|nr:hypothetical protein [Treponema sp.]